MKNMRIGNINKLYRDGSTTATTGSNFKFVNDKPMTIKKGEEQSIIRECPVCNGTGKLFVILKS